MLSTAPRRGRSNNLGPTAWLNGIRGIAALIVCFNHFISDHFSQPFQGYKSQEVDSESSFFQLPFIRIIFSFHAMVMVFFVISGYCQSYKPVRLYRSRQLEKLFEALSRSFIRRGPRLFFPVFVVATISQLIAYLGLYTYDYRSQGLPGPEETLREHIGFLWAYLTSIINPMFGQGTSGYNMQFWTLPVEFRGSIIVYIAHIGLSAIRTRHRIPLLISVMLYFFFMGNWDFFLFLGGFLAAEIDYNRHEKNILPTSKEATPLVAMSYAELKNIFLFILSFYLICMPTNYESTPGYMFLFRSEPPKYHTEENKGRFWKAAASLMLIISINQSHQLQRPFTTSIAQYLGRISFSLYILHVLLIRTFRQPLLGFTARLASAGSLDFSVTWYVTGIILGILLLWLSEWYYEFVDVRSRTIANFLFKASGVEPE